MATTHAQLDVTQTVAEWASTHPSVSRVFEKYNIDLCGDDDKSVIQACREHKIRPEELIEDLTRAAQPTHCEMGSDWETASISELCDHVEMIHHRYLRHELPRLSSLLQKVRDKYRAQRPELEKLQKSFGRFRGVLERHILTETSVLLPA